MNQGWMRSWVLGLWACAWAVVSSAQGLPASVQRALEQARLPAQALHVVVAPAQGGLHPNGRRTHGHSMIIDPWGHVVAKCSDGEGWATAWLEPDKLASVRRNHPCGEHRRLKA
mgnify:CR=1 FL=1